MAKTAKKFDYDLNGLKNFFICDESNKSALALALINKAVFIDRKLTELEEDIDINGLNIQMQQGDYFITRANPSCATYNAFIKNYNTVVKQIVDMLPAEEAEADEAEKNFF